MPVGYLVISLFCLAAGCYNLFIGISYILTIHFLLVSLYFYVIYFEIRGRPFSRILYLLLIGLFLADGLIHLVYVRELWNGTMSLFIAYFSWRSYQRLGTKR